MPSKTFQLAIGMPPEVVEALRGAPFRGGLEAIAHTLPYDMAVIGPGTVPVDLLKRWTCRRWSSSAPASPERAGRRRAGRWPPAVRGARLEVLDGVDHGAAPEALAPPVIPFLAGYGVHATVRSGRSARPRSANGRSSHSARRRAGNGARPRCRWPPSAAR